MSDQLIFGKDKYFLRYHLLSLLPFYRSVTFFPLAKLVGLIKGIKNNILLSDKLVSVKSVFQIKITILMMLARIEF